MAKPYYADYVNHILRFYFRYNRNKGFKNDVDKSNYIAADKVIQRLTNIERNIISDVFTNERSMVIIIPLISQKYAMCECDVWDILSTVQKRIAVKRGLI